MIGIGITTRNREEIFSKSLQQIKKFLPVNSRLIVVDDNSKDKKKNLEVDEYFYSKVRNGIAKSKNKCLELLEDCEHIFLFDDDFYPTKRNWDKHYIRASQLSGSKHLSFTFDYREEDYPLPDWVSEARSDLREDQLMIMNEAERAAYRRIPTRPIPRWAGFHEVLTRTDLLKIHKNPNGVMLYVSQSCLETVGGFNSDAPKYGGEHGIYSLRIFNAGLTPYPFPRRRRI